MTFLKPFIHVLALVFLTYVYKIRCQIIQQEMKNVRNAFLCGIKFRILMAINLVILPTEPTRFKKPGEPNLCLPAYFFSLLNKIEKKKT